jgi:hypothetical protein
MRVEITSSLNSRNFCYHSSYLISKNIQIVIYRIVILPLVLLGCEIWSFTLEEEYKLRLFESRRLRMMCGLKWGNVRRQ